MTYESIVEGTFLERPNRFLARVLVDGREVMAHVKNTGRCRELLIPGVCVYLQENHDLKRKTAYSLITVKKGEQLVNMDSQAPNTVAWEYISQGNIIGPAAVIQREKKFGDSRFDLYYEKDNGTAMGAGFIEVKGVTLEADGVARFPDAPTQRGLKHVYELAHAVEAGYAAGIIFVIQMKPIRYFTPNVEAQPEFLTALKTVAAKGVFIKAFECEVTEDSLEISAEVPVIL